VIAANPALTERDQSKRVKLTDAIAAALRERGVEAPRAALLAELCTVAFHQAFGRWVALESETDLGALAVQVLGELRAAAA
jgi:hypothetical protein